MYKATKSAKIMRRLKCTCLKFSKDISLGYPKALIISVRYLRSRNDILNCHFGSCNAKICLCCWRRNAGRVVANTQVETSVVSLCPMARLSTTTLQITLHSYRTLLLHLLEKRKPEVAFNEKQFQTLKSKSKAVENGMHCAVNMLRSFIKLKSSVSY